LGIFFPPGFLPSAFLGEAAVLFVLSVLSILYYPIPMHSMQTMIAFESTTPASPRKWPNMTAAAPMMHSSGPAEVSRIFDKFTLGFKIITPELLFLLLIVIIKKSKPLFKKYLTAVLRSLFILFLRFSLPVELSVAEVEGDVDHHHRDVKIIEIIRKIDVAFYGLRRDAAEIAEADEEHEQKAFAFRRPCAQRAQNRNRPGDAERNYHYHFEYFRE
jgi:hypothetical protein